jgi:hypothetical protein
MDRLIKQKGYRISPRWSLEDRMARFIQLYFEEKGRHIDFEEARCVCNLVFLKNNGDLIPTLERIVKDIGYHPMITRSKA